MTLAAHALDFGFGTRFVGRDVTLALEEGTVLCLLGPNGGGKTTLFRTLLGLIPPLGGRVTLDGGDIRRMKRGDVAQRVGYVPQAQPGYFPYTVEEMVLMGRTAHLGLFGQPGDTDLRAARNALARLGIAHLADRIYTQISGGERQLVLIARALALSPRLLVMDEPTASLDFGNRARVLAQIDALRASGVGIVLSTHDPDQVFAHGTQVALLHGGRLLACGAPESVVTEAALRQVYGIDVEILAASRGDGQAVRVCWPRYP
jgi:iron complex transport system ATP-binding protein